MCTPVCCILASTGIKNFSNLETVSVLKLDVSLIYKQIFFKSCSL